MPGSSAMMMAVTYRSGGVFMNSRRETLAQRRSGGWPTSIGPISSASNEAARSEAAIPLPDTSAMTMTCSSPSSRPWNS